MGRWDSQWLPPTLAGAGYLPATFEFCRLRVGLYRSDRRPRNHFTRFQAGSQPKSAGTQSFRPVFQPEPSRQGAFGTGRTLVPAGLVHAQQRFVAITGWE